MSDIVVIAFYKFVDLPDYEELQPHFLQRCEDIGVGGSILLAVEGINGMLAGSRQQINEVVAFLRSDPRLSDLETKESFTDSIPFRRMKVRLKQEIVALKVPGIDPRAQVGTYVDPKDWNALISSPDVRVIDTRNDFEVEIGTFKHAEDPQTEDFSDFPEYVEQELDPGKDQKIAMFCTGGIRCEKATSLLLKQGFKEVYHLRGGILKYLEEIPEDESLWEGECFVFDDRVTLDHQLKPGKWEVCRSCWQPLNEDMKASDHYEEGISCPRCYDKLTPRMLARRQEKEKQRKLAIERGEH